MVREQSLLARFHGTHGAILFERRGSSRAILNLPLLATFAAHANPLLPSIEILQIEPDEFADAQAAPVQQLENQTVAFGERPLQTVFGYRIDKVVGLLGSRNG